MSESMNGSALRTARSDPACSALWAYGWAPNSLTYRFTLHCQSGWPDCEAQTGRPESRTRPGELLFPEGVLHLFASLLQIPLGLVALALSFKRLVVRHLARRLFDVTFRLLGFVLGFVDSCHD